MVGGGVETHVTLLYPSAGFGFVDFATNEAMEKVLNTRYHLVDGNRVNILKYITSYYNYNYMSVRVCVCVYVCVRVSV